MTDPKTSPMPPMPTGLDEMNKFIAHIREQIARQMALPEWAQHDDARRVQFQRDAKLKVAAMERQLDQLITTQANTMQHGVVVVKK